jgi:arsenical pump membrane protein
MALLIGVNAGPLVTVWASLATLLWRQRGRTQDLEVGGGYLAREGLLCAVVSVAAGLGALAVFG